MLPPYAESSEDISSYIGIRFSSNDGEDFGLQLPEVRRVFAGVGVVLWLGLGLERAGGKKALRSIRFTWAKGRAVIWYQKAGGEREGNGHSAGEDDLYQPLPRQ